MTIEFCYLLFVTADYYAISNFAIPTLLHRKRYGWLVAAVVLLITVFAAVRTALAAFISTRFFHPAAGIDFGGLYQGLREKVIGEIIKDRMIKR